MSENDQRGRVEQTVEAGPLTVDWRRFSAVLRAAIGRRQSSRPTLEKQLGISHPRLHAAVHGQAVGTEIFLTLCEWLGEGPMSFVDWRAREFVKADVYRCARSTDEANG